MDPELQRRLDEHDKQIAEIHQRLHKIDRHFFWGRVFLWFNIILFVAPFIVGYFFLMPLLQEGLGALTNPGGGGADINSVQNLLDQYKQLQ
jgi:type VI protein secretion system component VasF